MRETESGVFELADKDMVPRSLFECGLHLLRRKDRVHNVADVMQQSSQVGLIRIFEVHATRQLPAQHGYAEGVLQKMAGSKPFCAAPICMIVQVPVHPVQVFGTFDQKVLNDVVVAHRLAPGGIDPALIGNGILPPTSSNIVCFKIFISDSKKGRAVSGLSANAAIPSVHAT